MEKFMIKEILNLVGFTNAEGRMTTGTSNANMVAMMSARNTTLKHVKSIGLLDSNRWCMGWCCNILLFNTVIETGKTMK